MGHALNDSVAKDIKEEDKNTKAQKQAKNEETNGSEPDSDSPSKQAEIKEMGEQLLTKVNR